MRSDNRVGYEYNSMPLIYVEVSTLDGVCVKNALFLIDSGAISETQFSLYLVKKMLHMKIEDPSKPVELNLKFKNWKRNVVGKIRYNEPTKNFSIRENSVLGLPWMKEVKPLFTYEGVKPALENRLAILFPSSGKGYYQICIRNPKNGKKLKCPVVIDTGAPISTFPNFYVNALGLEVFKSNSYPDGKKKVFNWFADIYTTQNFVRKKAFQFHLVSEILSASLPVRKSGDSLVSIFYSHASL